MSDHADLIRRAAAHVRYLAGDPAEWDMDTNNLTTFEVHEQDERGWWSRLIGRSFRPTRALHVAAWDPTTAHHVADMLACAASVPERDRDGIAFDRCGNCGTAHLVNVARALLGEDSE